MPEKITVENLTIDDSAAPADCGAFFWFNNYNNKVNAENRDTYTAPYPIAPCRELILRGVKTTQGRPWKICENENLTPALHVTELE